jgi:hypothetical protein
MKLALLYRCSRQLGRAALPRMNRITFARQLALFPKLHAKAFSTDLNFPGIFEESLDVAPVIEDAMEDDIVGDDELFREEHVAVQRIMSPTEASFTVVDEESNHFDQDYDQYTLHMSTFQAYNTTQEYLQPELGLLDPEDVSNLEEVENYWESHPDAYSDDLPPPSAVGSDEFAPDVEDI